MARPPQKHLQSGPDCDSQTQPRLPECGPLMPVPALQQCGRHHPQPCVPCDNGPQMPAPAPQQCGRHHKPDSGPQQPAVHECGYQPALRGTNSLQSTTEAPRSPPSNMVALQVALPVREEGGRKGDKYLQVPQMPAPALPECGRHHQPAVPDSGPQMPAAHGCGVPVRELQQAPSGNQKPTVQYGGNQMQDCGYQMPAVPDSGYKTTTSSEQLYSQLSRTSSSPP